MESAMAIGEGREPMVKSNSQGKERMYDVLTQMVRNPSHHNKFYKLIFKAYV